MTEPLRILVVTVVHHPLDARIHRRQIASLLDAGHRVTYAAPWSAYGVSPSRGITALELPRAAGRRRVRALRAARYLLRAQSPQHDLTVIHDPELLIAARLASIRSRLVWDVHEDTVAAMRDRPWLPSWLRRPAIAAVTRLEAMAERNHRLILAEEGYVNRFRRPHPVIRNLPRVPNQCPKWSGERRIIYVGRISRLRGAEEMLRLGRMLRGRGLELHLVGSVDSELRTDVERAHRLGDVVWHGFLENSEALSLVDGAVAGISLLHDVPNYRVSAPTKVFEYLSRGVPVVTSPLPIPASLVEELGAGIVTDPSDLEEIVEYAAELADHPQLRLEVGQKAHEYATRRLNWATEAGRFVTLIERWARAKGVSPR